MNPFALLPHPWLTPLRRWAACRPRGSALRNGAHLALRAIAPGRRISAELSEIRPVDRPDLTFEAVDSMVMDALYWFGVQGYEGRLGDIWPALCARSANTLEVGGNVGLFSVLGGSVAAGPYTVVEPIPDLCSVIRRNLARNQVARVDVLEGAAIPDDTPAMVRLRVPVEAHAAPVGAHLDGRGEVHGRSLDRVIEVPGHPFATLAGGRDLIKIDAEGIEADLLASARDVLTTRRPVLVVEVLPEAARLAALLRDIALDWQVPIHAVPAYGSDTVVRLDAATFEATTPALHRSKDVLLGEVPDGILSRRG